MWNHENKQTDDRYNYDEDLTSYDGDLITIQELDDALLKTKNRKATGQDGINAELYKYGGLFLKLRLLHLYNMCWKSHKIPEDWLTA